MVLFFPAAKRSFENSVAPAIASVLFFTNVLRVSIDINLMNAQFTNFCFFVWNDFFVMITYLPVSINRSNLFLNLKRIACQKILTLRVENSFNRSAALAY
jgi:hypothetical protein